MTTTLARRAMNERLEGRRLTGSPRLLIAAILDSHPLINSEIEEVEKEVIQERPVR